MANAYDVVKYFMEVDPSRPPTKKDLEEAFPNVKFKVVTDKDGTLLVDADLFSLKKTKTTTDIDFPIQK